MSASGVEHALTYDNTRFWLAVAIETEKALVVAGFSRGEREVKWGWAIVRAPLLLGGFRPGWTSQLDMIAVDLQVRSTSEASPIPNDEISPTEQLHLAH